MYRYVWTYIILGDAYKENEFYNKNTLKTQHSKHFNFCISDKYIFSKISVTANNKVNPKLI